MSKRKYGTTPTGPGEYREENARAVRPRDAATLIVVRQESKKPKILMGKRAASHKFMPNKFVFPGGRLDLVDQRLNVPHDLAPPVMTRLRKATQTRVTDNKLRGLALAAIRETYEETGMIIAQIFQILDKSLSTILWLSCLLLGKQVMDKILM